MGVLEALLLGLTIFGLGGIGKEYFKAFVSGPKMAEVHSGLAAKQHERGLETHSLIADKTLAREKELLARQAAMGKTARQHDTKNTILNLLGQQLTGDQNMLGQALAASGNILAPPAPQVQPGMGMVDILRMR